MTETVSHRGTGRAPGAASRFDAFMSYAHAADDLLAPRLQSALQSFAKPWWRRRALRVFRDQASLSANPHLWTSITDALGSSSWFILLASPQAASSEWVDREVEWWLEHGETGRILPVVTDGEFAWDEAAGRLDHDRSTAAPPALVDAFDEEPRWVDLRFARTDEQLDMGNARFRDAVADLASAIRGVAKDDLESEEVLRHRSAMRTAWTAAIALALLVVVAIGSAIYASTQRSAAVEQAAIATGRGLGAQATLLVGSELDTALLVGAEAVDASADDAAYGGLLASLNGAQHLVEIRHDLRADGGQAAFSADGRFAAFAAADGSVTVWDTEGWTPVGGPLAGPVGSGLQPPPYAIALTPDGSRMVTSYDPEVRVWSVTDGELIASLSSLDHPATAISPDGRYVLAVPDGSARAHVWDIDTGDSLTALDLGARVVGDGDRVAFSPGGSQLAFEGRGLTVVDFPSGVVAFEDFEPVEAIAWSPAGGFVAAAGLAGIRIVDTVEMVSVVEGLLPEGPADAPIDAMAFSPSGDRLAVKTLGGPVTVFELVNGGESAAVIAVLPGIGSAGGGAGWLDDGRIATADGAVAEWDLDEATALGSSIAVPGPVWDLRSADDGSLFAATPLGIYRIADDAASRVSETDCATLDVSERGLIVASPCGGVVRATLVESWSVVGASPEDGLAWVLETEGPVYGATLSPDGASFVTLREGLVEVRATADGAVRQTIPLADLHPDIGSRPVWLSDDLVVAPTGSGELAFVELTSERSELVAVGGTWTGTMALHPDGRRLFVSSDNGIGVVDVMERTTAWFGDDAGGLAVSPDGHTLAVLSDRLQLWDIDRAAKIGPPLRGRDRGHTAITWDESGLHAAGIERYGSHVSGLIPVTDWAVPGNIEGDIVEADTATIIEWELESETLVQRACRLAGRSLTEEEWAEYLPGVDYDPVC